MQYNSMCHQEIKVMAFSRVVRGSTNNKSNRKMLHLATFKQQLVAERHPRKNIPGSTGQ